MLLLLLRGERGWEVLFLCCGDREIRSRRRSWYCSCCSYRGCSDWCCSGVTKVTKR